MTIIYNFARQCDHGVPLVDACPHCDQLLVWRGLVNALALVVPLWAILGLALIWWIR